MAHNNPAGPYHGTGYYTSLFLVLVAGLVFSIVMLQSDVFGKWTAVSGILANQSRGRQMLHTAVKAQATGFFLGMAEYYRCVGAEDQRRKTKAGSLRPDARRLRRRFADAKPILLPVSGLRRTGLRIGGWSSIL